MCPAEAFGTRSAWLPSGLVGGSDGHRPRDPYVLTGAYAPALTREALWDALYHRRTVATTGAQRIRLAFRVDGEWQGSLLALDTLPEYTIEAEGPPDHPRGADRERRDCATWDGTGNRFVVRERLARAPERPDNYYYVRLLQSDGNLAWSSPIWVSYLPELPKRVAIFTGCLGWTCASRSPETSRREAGRFSACAASTTIWRGCPSRWSPSTPRECPAWSRSTRVRRRTWRPAKRSSVAFDSRTTSERVKRSSTCSTRTAIAIGAWCVGDGSRTREAPADEPGSARRCRPSEFCPHASGTLARSLFADPRAVIRAVWDATRAGYSRSGSPRDRVRAYPRAVLQRPDVHASRSVLRIPPRRSGRRRSPSRQAHPLREADRAVVAACRRMASALPRAV